jgi:hypothetical protein
MEEREMGRTNWVLQNISGSLIMKNRWHRNELTIIVEHILVPLPGASIHRNPGFIGQ